MAARAANAAALVPLERIQRSIFVLRGEKIMLDADLATLYGVRTKVLVQALKRNSSRFPGDFAFQASPAEAQALRSHFVNPSARAPQGPSGPAENLRSQIVTSRSAWGGRRYRPYVFTEQGVAMLSSVLRSRRAVQVNVAIMRAFVALRRLLADHTMLARRLSELERRYAGHDQAIQSLFEAIRQLLKPARVPRREMGFHTLPAMRAAR
jgi:hypothetical protein